MSIAAVRPFRSLLAAALAVALAACGPAPTEPDAGETTPDSGTATPDSGTVTPDGGQGGDAGTDPGDEVTVCANPAIPSSGEATCSFLAGQGDALLIRGTILSATGALENGHLLIGGDGKILCAACDCSADPAFDSAKVVACPNGVVSPGLINAHDHITFTGLKPADWGTERYDHRHDWRKGKRGHTKIPSPSTPGAVGFGELRQVLGGATSLVGSGGSAGLLRNLDMSAAFQEGLARAPAKYETFPLGDNDGTQLASGCAYPDIDKPTATAIANTNAYVPHVAEGIDTESRNEFLCVSGQGSGSQDLLMTKTSVIHGIGLLPQDYVAMATKGTALIWSPRSNISLYGGTAQVTTAARAGVQVALGTDWTASGSINVLRELKCADELNVNFYGRFFSDREIVEMSTKNAAAVMAVDDVLGSLKAGYWADVAVFDGAGASNPWRAILDSDVKKVALVLRGGKVLHGDTALVDGLGSTDCEALDVCGTAKKVCAKRETTLDVAGLKSKAGASAYGLFFCGVPEGEPTCLPSRPNEFAGQSLPTDIDGDGVDNEADNCPTVFNPERPVDGNVQGNVDGDAAGDACDPCPLAADATECPPVATDDRDFDGVKDDLDNCVNKANLDQLDGDGDGTGDACDPCPTVANAEVCPATIYSIKQSGASSRVKVDDALVTAVGPTGYFIAHVPGDASYDNALGVDYSSLFVFTSAAGAKPAVGDRIDVTGTAGAYYGQTQLSASTFTVDSSGNAVPAPVLIANVNALIEAVGEVENPDFRADALEGALIRVENVTVTNVEPALGPGDRAPSNEFEVAGGLRVNDYFYKLEPGAQANETLGYVQGVLRFANDNYKIEPRNLADIGRPVALLSLSPAESWLAVGATGPTPPLVVKLTRPSQGETVVTLQSSDSSVTVAPSVSVLDGQSEVVVPVSASAATAASVTITASYNGTSRTAVVKPYDPAGTRTVTSVTLEPNEIRLNSAPTVTVTLDAPAGPGGLVFGVASSDAAKISFPAATFTVEEGSLTGSIAGSALAEGPVTVTVTRGAETEETFDVTVLARPAARVPGLGDLVVNEVLCDPPGTGGDSNKDGTVNTTDDEFVEFVNASAGPLIIAGLEIWTSGGGSVSKKFTIPTGTAELEPGKAFVVFSGGTVSGAGSIGTAATNPADPFLGSLYFSAKAQGGNAQGLVLSNSATLSLDVRVGTAVIVTYTNTLNPSDQAATRSPDITGEFALSKTVATGGAAFTAGTKVDGSAF